MTPADKKGRRKQTTKQAKNFDEINETNEKSPARSSGSYPAQSTGSDTKSSGSKKGTNVITLINPLFSRQVPAQNQQDQQQQQSQGEKSQLFLKEDFQQVQQKQEKRSLSILIPQNISQQKPQITQQVQPQYSANGLPQIPVPSAILQQTSQSSVILPSQSLSQIKIQMPRQMSAQQQKQQGPLKVNQMPQKVNSVKIQTPQQITSVQISTSSTSSSGPQLQKEQQSSIIQSAGQNQRLQSSQGIEGASQQTSQQQNETLEQLFPSQKNQDKLKGISNNQQAAQQIPQQQISTASTPSLTTNESEKPRKKYKNLVDSDSDDEAMCISIKKKKVHIEEKPVQVDQAKLNLAKQSNTVVISVPPLNINKSFQEVLQQTSKEPSTLTMVRNILSSGSKKLADKQIIFKKKWNQLRNSNCSHEEYLKWEEQIKSSEAYEIKDIKETTIQRLINSKIRGFTSQEQLIEKGKKEYLVSKGLEDDIVAHCREFILDEKQYEDYRSDQFKLLEKLMRENNLVSSGNNSNFFFFDDGSNTVEAQGIEGSVKTEAEKQLEILDDEENATQRVSLCKYFENKKTTMESEQAIGSNDANSTAKTTSESLEIEKNIEKYFLPKIFTGYDELTKLKQGDTSKIAKRVRSLMIGGKSEEIFTDAKFLKEQFDRYQQILKKINDSDELNLSSTEDSTISELIETAAYIMNNVHYFQKFDLKYNLKCDLLHPLDLIYVADKFLKSLPGSRKKKEEWNR